MEESLSLALPAALTIETVEAVAAVFAQLPFAEKMTLTLDASHVENITTPGLQLLVSLKKTLVAQGGALVVSSKPECMINALADTGFQSLLVKE